MTGVGLSNPNIIQPSKIKANFAFDHVSPTQKWTSLVDKYPIGLYPLTLYTGSPIEIKPLSQVHFPCLYLYPHPASKIDPSDSRRRASPNIVTWYII